MKVGLNTRVVVKYSVRFDNELENEALNLYKAELIVGHDRILPAIEERLMGAEQGDTFEVLVPKEQFLGNSHPIYATFSIEEVHPATAEEIEARRAKNGC